MIRWVDPASVGETIAGIQFRAVREGRSLYSEAQRRAWLPQPHPAEALTTLLADADVALFRRDGEDVGLMTLEAGGYICFAFILPDHQGTGIFRALTEAVEDRARAAAEPMLWTFASLMAQPAFQCMGFSVIHHEELERGGLTLPRARMEKQLP